MAEAAAFIVSTLLFIPLIKLKEEEEKEGEEKSSLSSRMVNRGARNSEKLQKTTKTQIKIRCDKLESGEGRGGKNPG